MARTQRPPQHIKYLTYELSVHKSTNPLDGGDEWTTKADKLNDKDESKHVKKQAYIKLKESVDVMAKRLEPIELEMRTHFLEGTLDEYVRRMPVGLDEHGKLPAVFEKQDWGKMQDEAKKGMEKELKELQALVAEWISVCDKYTPKYGT